MHRLGGKPWIFLFHFAHVYYLPLNKYCNMKNNQIVKQILKQIIIFILSYQLLFTNSISYFITLFILFLIHYILLLREIIFIHQTIKKEMITNPNVSSENFNKVKSINSYLSTGILLSTLVLIAIIIYRYPLWISLFK